MKILQYLFSLADALQAGKQLSDSKNWKQWTVILGAMSAILHAAIQFMPEELAILFNETNINGLANGLAIAFSIGVSYSTVATTKTLGLPPKNTKQTK